MPEKRAARARAAAPVLHWVQDPALSSAGWAAAAGHPLCQPVDTQEVNWFTQGMTTRITFTLHELVAALDGYADRVLGERFGVSFNHFVFLAVLADVEPSDMTTLASCLGISKAAVSKRVPALVEGGWITGTPGAGRSILLQLTERGATLVREAGDVLEGEFTELLGHPALAEDPVDAPRLDRQLSTLAHIVRTTTVSAAGTPQGAASS